MEVGREASALEAKAQEVKGGVMGKDAQVRSGSEEVTTAQFIVHKREIGVKSRGSRGRGGKWSEAAAPEVGDGRPEGAGVGTLLVAGEGAEG